MQNLLKRKREPRKVYECAGGAALVALAVLLYLTVKSIPATMMILLNLPLALIGGVIFIALTGTIISVASITETAAQTETTAKDGLAHNGFRINN